MRNRNVAVLLRCGVALLVVGFLCSKKSGKSGSLGRKNFLPGQGEKIIENILKIFVKIFGGMKNIY